MAVFDPFTGFVRDEDLILFRILEDLVGERPMSRLDLSKDDGKIGLADLAVTDETAKEVTDLFCLCKKEEPLGIEIDAMARDRPPRRPSA